MAVSTFWRVLNSSSQLRTIGEKLFHLRSLKNHVRAVKTWLKSFLHCRERRIFEERLTAAEYIWDAHDEYQNRFVSWTDTKGKNRDCSLCIRCFRDKSELWPAPAITATWLPVLRHVRLRRATDRGVNRGSKETIRPWEMTARKR